MAIIYFQDLQDIVKLDFLPIFLLLISSQLFLFSSK